MPRIDPRAALLALAAASAAAPGWAASSASSASSDGVSASVGSLSDSIEGSSRSSSNDDRVADGDYTVVDLAEAAARPGQVRVALRRDDRAFVLYLPHETAREAGLAAGRTVTARQREHGVEFAAGSPRRTFFLALNEPWLQDLRTQAIGL